MLPVSRPTTAALGAAVVLLAMAPAAPAAAAAPTTFDGSCTLTGDYMLLPPGAAGTQFFENGVGTCTGSLDGGPSQTHQVAQGTLVTRGVYAPVAGTAVVATGNGGLQFEDGSWLSYSVAVAAGCLALSGASGNAVGTIGGPPYAVTLTFTTAGTLTSQ